MKTTHTYLKHPQDYYLPEFIDLAPLEAAYRGLCVLFGLGYVFYSGCSWIKGGMGD